jgi:putative SOS response-associated peptidase YedK
MSPGVSSSGRAWARSRISSINETMGPIHDRLPAILPPAAWDAWLDPTNDDTEALAKLLVPAPAELLVARPVTTAVNSTRNDGPEVIAEATGDQLAG